MDGIRIKDIETTGIEKYLREIQRELIDGRYVPSPVKRVMIPKPDGKLVRYADDSVIICKNKKSANHALELLRYITGKLDLTLHPVKTKIVCLWDGKPYAFQSFRPLFLL